MGFLDNYIEKENKMTSAYNRLRELRNGFSIEQMTKVDQAMLKISDILCELSDEEKECVLIYLS